MTLVVVREVLRRVLGRGGRADAPTTTVPSMQDALHRKESEAVAVESGSSGRWANAITRRSLIKHVVYLLIAGIALYLLLPSLTEVFSSWPRLQALDPVWVAILVGLQAGSLASMWTLQRLAIRTRAWLPIVTSQLAANAFSRVVPGGAAAGAALQFRMLGRAGFPGARIASGLTTSSLLSAAVLFALPVLALPALLGGAPVDPGLSQTVFVGVGALAVMFAIGSIFFFTNRALLLTGWLAERVANRVLRGRRSVRYLPARMLRERNMIRKTFGKGWAKALLATIGRWGFDYLTLLGALVAIGADPDPSLVLLAFVVAQILGMIPITPGGIGFVEAGLTATLALAGVNPGDAVVATLIYRLMSYWLPLPIGLLAATAHRILYGGGRTASAETARAPVGP
jgi:uncharacterized protein (TIRG00374 family)